ncbi:hypothetical protein [Photobacterium phosphoreum]|uniref:hypothetical protein n=1 Tax=Photobacterium phosphoreum TaxID=659 RepID=UPI000D1799B7|nr:hypothetical protein [Photobacterium phosphoreum]PSU76963.1 hypothetical protein CTM67_13860 [Photobacterium phosphoreum]
MGQTQRISQNNIPTVEQSLANIHALFGSQSHAGLVYDNLAEDFRRAICSAARLTKAHINMPLADMDEVSRAKLHRAINTLADALKPLANRSLKDFR